MIEAPLVSVLMSVHNGRAYLAAAIDSILSQTLRDLEFLIVDDASTDGASEICAGAARRDARVVLLRNEVREGLARSLNRALGRARGEFVARMDADDVSLPERLARQVAYLQSHPEIGLAGSFYTEIGEDGDVLVPLYRFPTEPIVIRWRMAFENPIPHPPIVVRRALLEAAGGYDDRWATAQDFDLFTRLADRTRLTNCPEVLFLWRRHGGSVSAHHNLEQRRNAVSISRAYVSRLLGREVPLKLADLLWTRQPANVREASTFVRTAIALCRAVLAEPHWSADERRTLRRFVSLKLVSELTPYAKDPRSWAAMAALASLRPALVADVAAMKRRALAVSH